MDTVCRHVSVIQSPIATSSKSPPRVEVTPPTEESPCNTSLDVSQLNLLNQESAAIELRNVAQSDDALPSSSSTYVHWKKGMLPKITLPAQLHPNATGQIDNQSKANLLLSSSAIVYCANKWLPNPSANLGKGIPSCRQLYCELCDRNFSSSQYLRIHLRYFHSADKQFICRICNDKTKLLSNFKLHLLSIHKKTWKQYLGMVEFVLVSDADKLATFPVPELPLQPKLRTISEYRPKQDTVTKAKVIHDANLSTRCLICKQQLKFKSLANHVKHSHGMAMRKYSQLAEC